GDVELRAGTPSCARIALSRYLVRVAVDEPGSVPHHDEPAVRLDRDRRPILRAGRDAVDEKLPALARTVAAEALAEHRELVVRAVAVIEALPHHDEAAVLPRRHLRPSLGAVGVRVHHELVAALDDGVSPGDRRRGRHGRDRGAETGDTTGSHRPPS